MNLYDRRVAEGKSGDLMSLNEILQKRLTHLLNTLENQTSLGPRLSGDANRLWNRLSRFIEMKLVSPVAETQSLELACYALQLPNHQGRAASGGKPIRTNLHDRCEQSAELMVTLLGSEIEDSLLDRSARILHETPQRSPMLEEARLLADAVNLDDFGLIGLVNQAMHLALHGEGLRELAVACEKREQYGYWEARLKDGFHFEPVRQLAMARLENARKVIASIQRELDEDSAG